MVLVWLSGVVNVMRLALRLAGWLDVVYRKADSWLSLGSLWLLASSWLCLDRCLVIGGVVLFVELVFCAFFYWTLPRGGARPLLLVRVARWYYSSSIGLFRSRERFTANM